ncbi:MAG: class I SAM-dependent methyltransferase [Gemmatimonadota bacterium]|nr:class I SAM-dependent methyltransferase [Gemmatimonadota bacterium]
MSEYQYLGRELPTFAGATRWKAYIRSLLKDHLRGRVLEVGSGIGATTEALWNVDVSSWLCLEPDPDLAAQCSARLESVFGRGAIDTIVGGLAELDGERTFDAILFIDVLEHIEDDRDELARASLHLAPGGALIVVAPAYQWLYSEFDRAVGHFRRYSRGTLAAVFPASLTQERLVYADSLGALLSLGNRVLLHRAEPARGQILLWDRVIVPLSRVADVLIDRSFGRSLVAIYRRGEAVP